MEKKLYKLPEVKVVEMDGNDLLDLSVETDTIGTGGEGIPGQDGDAKQSSILNWD